MIFKVINLDQISKKVGVIENKEIGDVHDVSHGTLYYVGQGWKNEKTSKETTGNQLRQKTREKDALESKTKQTKQKVFSLKKNIRLVQ